MAIAKRRDDVLLKTNTGVEMRKSMKGYSLEFLNTLLRVVLRNYHRILRKLYGFACLVSKVWSQVILHFIVRNCRNDAVPADHLYP